MQKKGTTKRSQLPKAKAMLTSRIRRVGNAKGVILNDSLIEAAGLNLNEAITLEATAGAIVIAQAKPAIKADLKSWDKQFKNAQKKGAKPEADLFEGLANNFDNKEW